MEADRDCRGTAVMSRPWTPGPWSLVTDSPYAGSSQSYEIRYGSGDRYGNVLLADEQYYPTAPEKMADAELIALAPEMAEALLLWARAAESDDAYTSDEYVYEMNTNGAIAALSKVVDKLLAIGESDD